MPKENWCDVNDRCAQYSYSKRICRTHERGAIYSRTSETTRGAGRRGLAQWDDAAEAVHPGRFNVLIPLEPPPTMENCIFFDALHFSRSN
ncbi:unnamed protein product, partial [Brenthis ino]